MSMQKLDAEVLTIGDELNRGEIVDTNSSWLAEQLTALGAHVRWRSSVTDDTPDLEAAVRTAAARAHVVICSGGLGPTEDDRTVDVVARLCGVDAVGEPAHEQRMRARFEERNFKLTPNNLRQVRVPSGSTVLANKKGLAPGFRVELGDAELYFMPGVPREMKTMFLDEVATRIAGRAGDHARAVRRTWRVAAMGESHVDHALAGVLDGVDDATLHYRIAFPENLVTIVVRRAHEPEARAELERLDGEVRRRLGQHLYGVDDETLPEVVGARLRAARATLAVAESCTGGLVGELVTRVPGSSEYFKGGVVSYADAAKRALLAVGEETLRAHGAVSAATVTEMAAGARRAFDADYALAVSGIAGPGGGSTEKPVGTVWLAVAGPDGATETRHLYWPGDREQVRQIAAYGALFMLYRRLIGNP
jgi:nicotinamide-nucleotide amidase